MVETVILGASCWAFGNMISDPSKTLIVERGACIGDEYFNSYRKCCGWNEPLKSDIAKELQEVMKNKKLFESDLADFYGLAPILYKFATRYPKNINLTTEIEKIEKTDDDFRLTLYNQSGKSVVTCSRLIDTTPRLISNREWGAENIKSKRLNASLHGGGRLHESRLTTWPGRSENELFVSMTFDQSVNWTSARCELTDAIANMVAESTWRIASIAKEFDYEFAANDKQFEENCRFVAANTFDNPLKAIDEGYEAR